MDAISNATSSSPTSFFLKPSLGSVDYLVLISMLLVSLLIGLFYAIKDRKNQTSEKFLMAGKNMSLAPVAMSLSSTFMSATTLLGWPTEMYTKGTQGFVAGMIGSVVCSVLAAEIFVSIFYHLNLTSVNQYLSDRFGSKTVRSVTSFVVILTMLPQMGIWLYGPALALGSVTGLTITQCVLVMGGICTIYTSLGGLKAVIWTDVIQYGLMYAGIIVILVKGTVDAGGLVKVFQVSSQGGRLTFFDMTFDLYSSTNFWTSVIGTALVWSGGYGSNQMQVQRTCAMPTLKKARQVIYWTMPGFMIMLCLVCYMGLVIFANYSKCDPYRAGLIDRPDEILPFFVAQSLGNDYPGLPGLFVASVFSASLSTLSSALNAMAALIWDDFLKAKLPKNLPESKAVLITKSLALVIGILCILFAFLSSKIGTIFEASYVLAGASVGPIFGLFISGMFFPFVNGIGGLTGLLIGAISCTLITVGGITNPRPNLILPTSIEGCFLENITLSDGAVMDTFTSGHRFGFDPGFDVSTLRMINQTMLFEDMVNHAVIERYYPTGMNYLYHLSHFVIPAIGFLVTIVIGLIVSLLTGGCSKGKDVDPKLMSAISNRLRKLPATHGLDDQMDKRVIDDKNDIKLQIKINGTNNNNNYDSIKV